MIGVFVLVNVITNVPLNFALGLLECFPVDVSAIDVVYVIGECVAVAVEYLILKRVCRNKYLFLFVLCANIVSALAGGLLLRVLFN